MKKQRGYVCCQTPMVVTTTRRPTRNLIVRYRQCFVCGTKIITEERVSASRKPISPTNGTDTENTST